MEKDSKYKAIADKIAPKLPEGIASALDRISADRKTGPELKKMISFKDAGDIAMPDLIVYLMEASEKTTDLHEDRMKYRDAKRNRKLYLKKTAISDAERPDGGLLGRAWKIYSSYKDSPFLEQRYSSETEYRRIMVEKVVRWADESSSNLVDYPFFKFLSPVKQCRDFMTDCAYHTFDLLVSQYGNEMPSAEDADAPMMRTPSFISGKGVFSATSTVADLETEVGINGVKTYNNHTISTEDGEITIKTIVDSVPGYFREAGTDEGKNAIIESLSDTGRIKLANNMLDSVDLELFTHIFSSFNVEDVNRGRKVFRLRDLVKSMYTEAKDERKNSVIEHLNRLGSYKVEYTVHAPSGKVVEIGDISFFDLIYHIDSDNEDGELTFNASLHQADGQKSVLDKVKEFKAEDITVEVLPSTNIRDAIVSSMNTVIYAEMYKKIAPPKAKNMLMFLQSRRAEIYPETSLDISVSFLAQNFRLNKLRRSKQVKHLSEMVEPLKEAGVLVRDYDITKTSFHFDFMPFTETELAAYHIKSRAIEGAV